MSARPLTPPEYAEAEADLEGLSAAQLAPESLLAWCRARVAEHAMASRETDEWLLAESDT